MPSQYPVLDNKPIDQWRVTELREELRRRNLVTKGLKEELVKRLDGAMQKEWESENVEELGNGDEPNSDSQNNTDEEDLSPEGVEGTQTTLQGDNNIDKDASTENSIHSVLDVNPEHKAQNGDDIEVADLVGKDERETTTGDLDGTALENQNFASLSSIKYEDIEPQKFESSSSIVGIEEKENLSDLEGSAPVNQNITAQSDTQGEDTKPEMFEESKPPIFGTDEKEGTCDLNGSAPINQNITVLSSTQGEYAEPEKFVELKSLVVKSMVILSEQSNQIFEDNWTAEHFPLELVAKQEVVQRSSNSYPTGGGHSCMAIDEQEVTKNQVSDELEDLKNKVFVVQEVLQSFLSDKQETNISYAANEQYVVQTQISNQQGRDEEYASLSDADTQNASALDPPKKEDCVEAGSPEKLNLDRSSGDESMEEDILNIKHMEADIKYEEPTSQGEIKMLDFESEERTADDVSKSSSEMKDIVVEDVKPASLTEKRKLEEAEVVVNNGPPKRHRCWNPDTIKVPEQKAPLLNISTTPKNGLKPALHRTFRRSNTAVGVDSAKERIVPTPKKPATTSLRIDNFIRPFTLKALQEFLAKTGHVCDFWMDHIKTHCFVTYSSVEEATETRNAVYNLQWPPNGGRFLVAEFVDPQEVNMRLEVPPPSQAPISSSPAMPKVPPSQQTQSPQPTHQQNFRLPPPPPPPAHPPPSPPLSLSKPPIAKEPIPPPPSKMPELPVMTLDDLFKKTRATPRIYYLPLTEEQACTKLAAQSKRSQV